MPNQLANLDRLKTALADRYLIEREIGSGGMATVYVADDLKHRRKVAIKVLRPELAALLGAKRFLKEIETTANLQHPHILQLFDSGEADSFLYYVMPYVEGESLREKLTREKQLSVDELIRIAEHVRAALDYAHRHDVIHRDVKPENILLHDGNALVSDFGIALAVTTAGGTRLTETGLSLGTPHYMSPEQATGDREVDARTDVYALGCVLFEMLTGEPPHHANTAQAVLVKILTEDAPAPRGGRPSVPLHVDAAVRKSLEKLPADRFEGALDLVRALRDPAFRHSAANETAVSAAATGSGPPRLRIANVLALVGLGALSVWLWLRPAQPGSDSTLLARTTIPFPEGQVAQLPFSAFPFDLSEDGSRLTFVGAGDRQPRLYVRDLASDEAVALDGTEGARHPFFSPGSGGWIGFFAQGELRRATAPGPTKSMWHPGRNGRSWAGSRSKAAGRHSGPATGPSCSSCLATASWPWTSRTAFRPPILLSSSVEIGTLCRRTPGT